jgi:glycosyltransferase involved in cell wall biosynthesis
MMHVVMLVLNAFRHDTRVRKEAKSLTQAGYQVTVFALHEAGLCEHEIQDGYQVDRIHVRSRSWGNSSFMRSLKYLEFSLRFVYRTIKLHPAVLHAHDVNALVPGFVAARLTGAHLIYDSHELWSERRTPLLRAAWLRRLLTFVEGLLARRADAVITVNMSLARHIADRHRTPLPTVIMHSQEYETVERSDVLRQELDIPAGKHIAIYAGRLAPDRGLEYLIEAAEALDRTVVVLMGQDRMNGTLQRLIAERGVHERVLIREPAPPAEVLRYVASADLGVVPTQSIDLSYHYSLGNKIFHYLMAGIPLAVSDQPEKRHIVETYGVGAVFDQTDPKDIARAVNELLADENEYAAMCQRARKIAREKFNWQIESQKLLALYDRLLHKG